MNRRLLPLGAAMVLTLLAATMVVAKGPGVEAVLDPAGSSARTGEPTLLGVTLRDQNNNAVLASAVSFRLNQVTTDRTVTATATQSGERGHYVATVTLPAQGSWVVHVTATSPQMETQFNLGVLQVQPPMPRAAEPGTRTSPPMATPWLPIAIGALAVILLALLRRRFVSQPLGRGAVER